ncbi:NAD-dependent epimerase/dehydratase family protein [Candidatus Uhrbacteria bacterium]|nr:NAD-dependent epimerase/dehydratase family protein [Candidatus Uhrbacteria bacterium]
MPKYKTALVTGGAGFIGSHLVDALVRRRIKVYVVDDLSSGSLSNLNPNAHFTKLSITNPQFTTYLRRLKPDVIFHCAAQINVRHSIVDPPNDAQTNIMGTIALAHTAAQIGVKKIIFSSTGGAMYPDQARMPVSERTPPQPSSPYGISKRAAEMYLYHEYIVHGMPYVALRYANVYGPRQNAKGEAGVITIFASHMLEGKPVKIFGTGKQTRDYVYVEDIVKANMLAMSRHVVGEFNIGTGKETNVNALFSKLTHLTGYQMPARYEPFVSGEMMRSALDARLAKKTLGWAPLVSLDEGLKKTVAWFSKKA